jgi:DNA invertase Pin-like site-specific DNA recombinase
LNNVDRKPTKAKSGRKTGRKIKTKKKDKIIELFNKGLKQTDIVKQTGISKSYVSKVVKEFKQQN